MSVAQQMAIRQERLSHRPLDWLVVCGIWAQERKRVTGNVLAELQPIPTDLLVGGEDQKFIGIAKKMQARQPLLRADNFS